MKPLTAANYRKVTEKHLHVVGRGNAAWITQYLVSESELHYSSETVLC